jgi:hypothetical protein
MKRASMGAVDASKPCDLRYGKVVSTDPLSIQVTNQFVLKKSMLIVPKHLTNYKVKVQPEGGAEYELTIKNKLRTGDKVVLLRQAGGQFYLVLDKL